MRGTAPVGSTTIYLCITHQGHALRGLDRSCCARRDRCQNLSAGARQPESWVALLSIAVRSLWREAAKLQPYVMSIGVGNHLKLAAGSPCVRVERIAAGADRKICSCLPRRSIHCHREWNQLDGSSGNLHLNVVGSCWSLSSGRGAAAAESRHSSQSRYGQHRQDNAPRPVLPAPGETNQPGEGYREEETGSEDVASPTAAARRIRQRWPRRGHLRCAVAAGSGDS